MMTFSPPHTTIDSKLLFGEGLPRDLLEALPGGVAHLSADGSVITANNEAARFFGIELEELMRRGVSDYAGLTVDERGEKLAFEDFPIVRTLATGEPNRDSTIGIVGPDGEIRWALWNSTPLIDSETGEVVGAILNFIDITERRRSEQALAASEARLAALVASAPSMVVGANRDGVIQYVNRALPPITREEALGSSIYDIAAPKSRLKIRNIIERVISSGEPASFEDSGIGPTDPTLYEVQVGPVKEGDFVTGVTLIITDVTEKKSLEGRLLIADRLASVGTLAAGVAHEVNNPLTYLLANLDWLRRDYASGDEKLARRLNQAIEGAERIRSVVRDLSSFSQTQETNPIPVAVTDVLDSALRMTASEMRHRANVVKDYDSAAAKVADGARLGQVFVNLLINAAQAIPAGNLAGNEIRVSTEVTSTGRVRVVIHDSGIGVPQDVVQHVFDPFVTTKPPGVGTGLGLYVSHNIVASLGGTMWLESSEGQGTNVTVELPQASYSGRAITDAPPSQLQETPRARVLVIDDEEGILTFLRDSLHEHEVEAVSSGRAALARIEEQDFDVIVCDLIMPDISGMDVFAKIRAEHPALTPRVIFVTGATFTSTARDFLDSVPNPRLAKPFTSHAIRRAVAKTLRANEASAKIAN